MFLKTRKHSSIRFEAFAVYFNLNLGHFYWDTFYMVYLDVTFILRFSFHLFIWNFICMFSEYQGCYLDRKPLRDLPRRFTRYSLTPEICLNECKYQNYKFAGLQYGYLCFCGNGFGRYGKVADSYCNSKCLGDKARNCGAFWHNSVYSLGE